MGSGCLKSRSRPDDGGFFVLVRQLPPLEHGIHALDGADADPRGGIEGVARQALDDELFGELEVVVRRDVLLELLERLVAEVAAVDQEEHAARACELDEAVDEVDGGEGLAAAGGHLDQGAGTVLSQRLFEIVDGGDLGGPEAGGTQGGMCWRRSQRALNACVPSLQLGSAHVRSLTELPAVLRCAIQSAKRFGLDGS